MSLYLKLPTTSQNVMNAFSTLPRRIIAEKHKSAINILTTENNRSVR